MEDSTVSQIENLLKRYFRARKELVEALSQYSDAMLEIVPLSAISYERPAGSDNVYSAVEDYVLELEEAELAPKVDKLWLLKIKSKLAYLNFYQYRVIELRYSDGFKNADIAVIMHIAESTVYKYKRQALEILKGKDLLEHQP